MKARSPIMLTNSLLLCLRDLLPVFILFCYLRSEYSHFSPSGKGILNLIGAVVLLSLIVFFFYESISNIDQGNGIEWLRIISLSGGYLIIVLSHLKWFSTFSALFLKIGSVLLSVTHISSFLLFFSIYTSPNNLPDLLIGSGIGLAICFSFYTLLGFVLAELYNSRVACVAIYLWPLFLAGQLATSANYLQQMGYEIIGAASLYDVSEQINEASEYGYVVKALFGFDASPSVLYISVFVLGFITMSVLVTQKLMIKQEVTL